MADWYRCTDAQDRPVYINLSTAKSMFWNANEDRTIIVHPGDDEVWRVKEKPGVILAEGPI